MSALPHEGGSNHSRQTSLSNFLRPADAFTRTQSLPTDARGLNAVSWTARAASPLSQLGNQIGTSFKSIQTARRSPNSSASISTIKDRFPSPPLTQRSSFGAQQDSLSKVLSHESASSSGSQSTVSRTASSAGHGEVIIVSGHRPQGTTRNRTELFIKERLAKTEGHRLELSRLERRLDKLVELHYPHPVDVRKQQQATDLSQQQSWRSSTDVWTLVKRSVKSQASKKAEDMRLAEQIIVAWEDDQSVSRCPVCMIAFSMTIRKHHCRLCGKVVCAVPPNSSPAPIGRDQSCSRFWQYEWLSQSSREKGGIIVQSPEASPDDEVSAPKVGIRSCRHCLNSVLRQQEKSLPPKEPLWRKLHDALVQLEKDIDQTLPTLQDQVAASDSASRTLANLEPAERAKLLNTRRKIVSLLASFDSISKRLRDLPITAEPDSSGAQARLQQAIANRAAIFLQERMGLLKGMGSFEEPSPQSTARAKRLSKQAHLEHQRLVDERSTKLVVLLEQEQLVQTYLEEAQSRRQLVDAASLKINLEQIRSEIQRLQLD